MRHSICRTFPLAVIAALGTFVIPACAGSARLASKPTPQLEARATRDSLDPIAHYELGLARWSDGRYDDAESELTEAVALDPKYAQAYLALGYLVFARRPALWNEIPNGTVPEAWRESVRRAERYRRRALVLDPLVKTAVVRMAGPEFPEVHPDPMVDRMIRRGIEDYDAGRYHASFVRLNNLIDTVSSRMAGQNRIPWDSLPNALFWYRGLAAAQLGRYEVAIQDMRRLLGRRHTVGEHDDLLAVAPLRAGELHYVIGVIQQRSGLGNAAERSFKAALKADPGLYMAHVRLAQFYESRNRMASAVEERTDAADANPDDPSLLVDLGRTLLAAGDAEAAVEPLRRAIAMQPRLLEAYRQLGHVLVVLHDPGARATLDHFIELAPSTMTSEVADARALLNRLAGGW